MTEIRRRNPRRNWSAPATDCGDEGRDLNRFPQAAFGVQGLSSLRSSFMRDKLRSSLLVVGPAHENDSALHPSVKK